MSLKNRTSMRTFLMRGASAGFVLLCLISAVGVTAGEEEQGDLDNIKRTDDKPVLPTKVIKDDYLTVEGKLKNRPSVKVASYLVDSVHYGDWDSNFSFGIEKREAGKDKTAAKLFRKAMQAMGNNKRAQEYCNYYIGDSFYRAGVFTGYTDKGGHKYSPASEYFDKVIKLNSKSRFLLDALIKKAVCLAEEGKLSEAQAAFEAAETRIKSYRNEVMAIDTGYLAAADRARALAKFADAGLKEKKEDGKDKKERDYSQALASYKMAQTLASKAKDDETYGSAVDGELRVLVSMEDFGAARDRAKGIIDKFKEKADQGAYAMLPGAYIVMGMANFKQALKFEKNDQQLQADNKFAEARWNFLHVIVQFFENDEYVAKAHYFSGLCYEKLMEKERGGIDRARKHWSAVVNDYPKSVFVDFAQKKLTSTAGAVEAPAEGAADNKDKDEKKGEGKPDKSGQSVKASGAK